MLLLSLSCLFRKSGPLRLLARCYPSSQIAKPLADDDAIAIHVGSALHSFSYSGLVHSGVGIARPDGLQQFCQPALRASHEVRCGPLSPGQEHALPIVSFTLKPGPTCSRCCQCMSSMDLAAVASVPLLILAAAAAAAAAITSVVAIVPLVLLLSLLLLLLQHAMLALFCIILVSVPALVICHAQAGREPSGNVTIPPAACITLSRACVVVMLALMLIPDGCSNYCAYRCMRPTLHRYCPTTMPHGSGWDTLMVRPFFNTSVSLQ